MKCLSCSAILIGCKSVGSCGISCFAPCLEAHVIQFCTYRQYRTWNPVRFRDFGIDSLGG